MKPNDGDVIHTQKRKVLADVILYSKGLLNYLLEYETV